MPILVPGKQPILLQHRFYGRAFDMRVRNLIGPRSIWGAGHNRVLLSEALYRLAAYQVKPAFGYVVSGLVMACKRPVQVSVKDEERRAILYIILIDR